jgi:hypothetical protein
MPPPASILVQPAPPLPEKPVAEKPPEKSVKSRPKSPPVAPVNRPVHRPEPEDPVPSVGDDVAMARQWLVGGNPDEARQMLMRIQTRMVFQPGTPDQPDRSEVNAPATLIGIAMRAIDAGDLRRALRTINDICQMEHCPRPPTPVAAPQNIPVPQYTAPAPRLSSLPPAQYAAPPAPQPYIPPQPQYMAVPAQNTSRQQRWSGQSWSGFDQ